MKRIGVICTDSFLYQKIKLAVRDFAECERIEEENVGARAFDVCLVDTDAFPREKADGMIRMSRSSECELKIPFLISDLISLVKDGGGENTLYTNEENRCVRKGGRTIKLTELEFALIRLLLSERRFFSVEEILSRVWNGAAESGIVNVYIHYLREKLESDGEKIIISARGKGYRIDGRFMSGGDE